MTTAIVTGASAGLGRDYALEAAKYADEIWLIARRADRLEALKAQLGAKRVVVLALDLCDPASWDEYRRRLSEAKPDVKLLVNNAGYGKLGGFTDAPTPEQTGMVRLNCEALTAVASITLPYMRSGSLLLNTCSIAAYVPTPRMTVYSATKAYVFAFSKGLREELKGAGIRVHAACPGPMETEFLHVAGLDKGSKLFDGIPRVNPKQMARVSLKRGFQGKAVTTLNIVFRLYRVLCKLLPHNWLMRFTTA